MTTNTDLLAEAKAATFKTDVKPLLWRAMLDKIEEVYREDGSRRGRARSQGLFSADGKTCACYVTIAQEDGSSHVYFITVDHNWTSRQPLTFSVSRSYHSSEHFWEDQLARRDGALVIEGHHYRLGDENYQGMRGFGGRRHEIENIATGERIVSTNLWYQGIIPPAFREQLPDSHRWVEV